MKHASEMSVPLVFSGAETEAETNLQSPRNCQEVEVQAETGQRRKRKADTEIKTPCKRQRTDIGNTDEATKVMVIDLTTTSDEELPVRRAETEAETNLQSPRNCQTIEVQAETGQKRKRKSDTEIKTPCKRQRIDIGNTEKATKVIVIDLTKTSDEELPQAPTTTKKGDVSKPLPSNESSLFSINNSRGDFEAKYVQYEILGGGGYGSVYAGSRRIDGLPVAIKHIPRIKVSYQRETIKNVTYNIPLEVLIMQKLAAGDESVGKSAAVSLLDWYNWPEEVLLVMKRPVPCVDLYTYMTSQLAEHQVKDIMQQMVDAAIEMESKGIIHRDIKSENVLIEKTCTGLRVWIIDFGCSCFVNKKPFTFSCGTKRYFPPEHFKNMPCEAVPSNVWQLGTLLYDMLTMNTFDTCVFLKTPNQIWTEVEALNVTQDCKNLLRRCLIVDPSKRITLEQMQSQPWLNPPPNPKPTPSIGPAVECLQLVLFDQNRLNHPIFKLAPKLRLHCCD